jgi:hypothetical protein
MESSLFSDMNFIEPLKNISNKTYMPYKQIGFFEDKLLSKNISSLKTNLQKRVNFIKTYNSPQCFKNNIIKKSNGIKEISQKTEIIEVETKEEKDILPNISSDVDAISKQKTKSNFYTYKSEINDNKNNNSNNLIENISVGYEKKHNPHLSILSDNSRINFSNEKKNSSNIQAISTKHKNFKINHNLNIQNNNSNFDNKSRTTNNSNILKNQIISGHLNKEIQQMENKAPQIASQRKILYSHFTAVKADGEADTKSVMTAKKDNMSVNPQNKNVSVDCGNDSFAINNNKSKNGSAQTEIVDSKIDFVYKKIFDKKSRMLIEKPPSDKNNNEVKKKQKIKIESKASEFNFNNKDAKKRKYIEDKIEDIKRKIFFIKGVYDFSYPKIIVNKVKTAQDFYNSHHIEQKMNLRKSMNNTSQKYMEKFEEKCKITNEDFRKSFHFEKLFANSVEKADGNEFENLNYPQIKNKIIRSITSLELRPLWNPRLTLTQKFTNQNEIMPVKILNPISIQTIYPDLGEPSKLKVIHKSKIL